MDNGPEIGPITTLDELSREQLVEIVHGAWFRFRLHLVKDGMARNDRELALAYKLKNGEWLDIPDAEPGTFDKIMEILKAQGRAPEK